MADFPERAIEWQPSSFRNFRPLPRRSIVHSEPWRSHIYGWCFALVLHCTLTKLCSGPFLRPYQHYGPDTYNKNFLYYADDWLYPRRWEQLITNRDKVDIVEIITWNGMYSEEWKTPKIDIASPDYGESHYIGPIEGAQPNSQAWVNGFDHQGKSNSCSNISGPVFSAYTTLQAGST